MLPAGLAENDVDKRMAARYDSRLRELASELADRVAGEMTELEGNKQLVACQDRWSDAPWG
jgi:hypothetical protein